MILTLASAALIPSARLLAKPDFHLPVHHSCDKKLAEMITALERASWQAGLDWDVEAADAIYADDFFEILCDGSLAFKEDILNDLINHAWEFTYFKMSEIAVVPMNESSALIRYKIECGIKDGANVDIYHLIVTSSYAKIRGRWQGTSYQETSLDGTA